MSGLLRVAIVQVRVPDPTRPWVGAEEKATRLLGELARVEPDLTVFPEYFPFRMEEWVSNLAVELSAYLIAGVARRVGGTLVNTATLYSPGGEPVAWQGKRYVGRLEARLWGFTGWHGPLQVWDIGRARLGVAVCADFWSTQDVALELFLGGADLLVNPAYMFSLDRHWQEAGRVRALEYYAPVVGVSLAASRLETKRFTFTGGGGSYIIVPPASPEDYEEWWSTGARDVDSWVRVRLGPGEAVAYYDIDVAGVSRERREWWKAMRGMSLEEWLSNLQRHHRRAVLVRV